MSLKDLADEIKKYITHSSRIVSPVPKPKSGRNLFNYTLAKSRQTLRQGKQIKPYRRPVFQEAMYQIRKPFAGIQKGLTNSTNAIANKIGRTSGRERG